MLLNMSEKGKFLLENATSLHCDGTFETCPPPFKQIYWIFAVMLAVPPLPCAFMLLPDKKARTYRYF